MAKRKVLTTVALSTGLALGVSSNVQAQTNNQSGDNNPFAVKQLNNGYKLAEGQADGRCGAAKCGAGKCGVKKETKDQKCGAKKDAKDGRCGASCKGDKASKPDDSDANQ